MKHDQANTVSNSGAAIKQEDSMPYMLGPSIDQQQLGQHVLQDVGANISTDTAEPDLQVDNSRFQPHLSNPTASGQGQVFGDKNSRCEKHNKTLCHMNIPADRRSLWLQRLESWQSKSILGYA